MRRLVLWGAVVGLGSGILGGIAMQGCASVSCNDSETCVSSESKDGSADGPFVEATLPDATDATTVDRSEPEAGEGIEDAGDSGTSDDAADADGATPCTPGAPPAENGCIADASGVFVSTGGSDTSGTGTMTLPYGTVSHALSKLGKATAIYVCGGSYTDQITVSSAVTLYGGLTCVSDVWVYSGAAASVPVVTGSSPSFTLEVNAAAAVVDVEDMAFVAPDATAANPGESSIAVWLNASSHAAFERVTMTAGAGSAGAMGSAGDDWGDASAPVGANAMGAAGAMAQTCPCGSSAGSGGTATATGGSQGLNGGPSIDGGTGNDGLGGIYNATKSQCATGDNGATPPDQGGGLGEDAGGVLGATGWTGGTGVAGTAGGAGQGGGGGSGGKSASAAATTGGGSAGGCGGCGGGPGGGGGAGGSSFALSSVASTVTLSACTLTAGTAGAGGPGGPGQAGQPGGLSGDESKPGCPGGTGGTGGQAGGGGGGAGGYSVAVAYTGTKPTMQNGTQAAAGMAGGSGAAGSGGTPAATPGSAGIAEATLSF